MIDLKKPLAGVPGLLLMAALIFFGATIGIGVALVFTWIPMSDALANFLGGVVGAGLGAALAVIGAVYIQRKERRDTLTGPTNLTISRLGNAQRAAEDVAAAARYYREWLNAAEQDPADESTRLSIGEMANQQLAAAVAGLPDGHEFEWELFIVLDAIRQDLAELIRVSGSLFRLQDYVDMDEPALGALTIELAEAAAKSVDRLRVRLAERQQFLGHN